MDRVKRLFKAWRAGESSHGAAPLPDEAVPFRSPADEVLVEVVPSLSGAVRVGITKDRAGVFRLRSERWAPEFEVTGEAAWTPWEQLPRTGKSLGRARTIAQDWLLEKGEASLDEAEE